jgi:type II secretory pathway component PulF
MSIDCHMIHSSLMANVGEPDVYTPGWIGFYVVNRLFVAALMLSLWFTVCGGLIFLVYFLLTLPMRRATRARLFLDLLESVIQQGRPVEETLISLSHSNDQSMGMQFHLLAARLERGMSLAAALLATPRFLPRQITAMLDAGRWIGDMRKVLPACRQLLQDAVSQTRGALSYLVILTFVITPVAVVVLAVLELTALPKFEATSADMGGSMTGIQFLLHHAALLFTLQIGLLLLLWLGAFLYIAGPRAAGWFPVLDRLNFHLPWRRKRLQRDFSTLLALLLDSGVPEPEAVALAADGTANTIFRRRAGRVIEKLRQGVKLTQAVQSLDDSGEFAWRLANAVHGHDGFLQALAGWHESLDAKAFQQEQAAAHGFTSVLVLWCGLIVGTVAISVFMFLISVTDSAVLW